jgi:hypothetical protein
MRDFERCGKHSDSRGRFERGKAGCAEGRKWEANNLEVIMKSRLSKLWWSLMAMIVLSPSFAIAAGGGGAAPIVLVADTRKLTGILAWWANLYNESHLQFMILTIILIPVTGVIFGVLADIIMNWIGIDLKSRDLAEH